MKFVLNGCDISFLADAPEDITLKELLVQADKIKPDWCACGIRSADDWEEKQEPEIIFTKDSVKLANDDVCATIAD